MRFLCIFRAYFLHELINMSAQESPDTMVRALSVLLFRYRSTDAPFKGCSGSKAGFGAHQNAFCRISLRRATMLLETESISSRLCSASVSRPALYALTAVRARS